MATAFVEKEKRTALLAEKVEISVVIPVYNEAENAAILASRILKVLSGMGRTFEVIFIDDGSRDGTEGALKSLSEKFSRIKAVRFRRNCGQTAALAAGFQYASGDIIVTLDGDLQNDPEDIPNLVAKLEEGYDVVSGWRKDRKDNFVKRTLPSMVANKLISSVSGVALHDYGCSLKAYRAETAKALPLYGELHRFIPALAGIEGARIAEMAVCHHPRRFGKSKYTITRTFRVILDLMTVVFLRRFMTRPLHVFGGAGLVSFVLGFLVCAYLAMDKLAFGHSLGNRPLLDLGVLLIVTGVQLISTGIIAEILIRTYFESQHKAIFRVKELYGFGGEQGEKE
jgi:glycosyltransferase involved in cell wall biosynthesis